MVNKSCKKHPVCCSRVILIRGANTNEVRQCSQFVLHASVISKQFLFSLQPYFFRCVYNFWVTIGISMGNGAKNKISSKKHLLMVLVQIRHHFTIVMWQKYLLSSGLRIGFPWPEVPFLAYPIFLEKCSFQCNFKIIGQAKKGVSIPKSPILRPFYNRYFCHITIIKWCQICTRTIRKCFFENILFLAPFPIEIPIVTQNFYTHRKK